MLLQHLWPPRDCALQVLSTHVLVSQDKICRKVLVSRRSLLLAGISPQVYSLPHAKTLFQVLFPLTLQPICSTLFADLMSGRGKQLVYHSLCLVKFIRCREMETCGRDQFFSFATDTVHRPSVRRTIQVSEVCRCSTSCPRDGANGGDTSGRRDKQVRLSPSGRDDEGVDSCVRRTNEDARSKRNGPTTHRAR
jgi:hypothetical protein